MTTLDDLARELGRARAAYERRRDNADLYRRMLEAQVAFQDAQLRAAQETIARERARCLALGKALRKRREGYERVIEQMRDFARPLRRSRRGAIEAPDLFGGTS
ncbi:hypothetical protein [Methylobrevis pamukkalensis]|nr:hypothetical protein [Methylobrevis pamukkalensis]